MLLEFKYQRRGIIGISGSTTKDLTFTNYHIIGDIGYCITCFPVHEKIINLLVSSFYYSQNQFSATEQFCSCPH